MSSNLYKSFSFINSSVQILQILRNSSANFRSSHRTCSTKKAIFKHFVIFTGKHLCWGLFFNKVAGFQACNFVKRRLQHKYFLVNIGKQTDLGLAKLVMMTNVFFNYHQHEIEIYRFIFVK